MSNEVFREIADCLCATYGTKWNGNAAADNGSLFVLTHNRVRRLTPTECERLQGFPDGWTSEQADTVRYKQLGNAVSVPVTEWIGRRIIAASESSKNK